MVDRAQVERELDDFVEGDSWPLPDEEGEPSPIPGAEVAAQVLRRLRRLDAERATVVRVATDELARIVAFRDDRVSGIEREIAWGTRSLENYMRGVRFLTKKQSMKVANGTLKLTKTSFAVEVVDEAAFFEWCGVVWPEKETPDGERPPPDLSHVTHPEFIRVRPEPAKAALAKLEHASLEEEVDGRITNQLLYAGDGPTELVPGVIVARDKADRFNVVLGSE
jgi:hypothetical protein